MMDNLVKIGGLFALLSFVHFFVDWLFQTHSEAMQKHNNNFIRAKHCLIYTLGFLPVFLMLSLPLGTIVILSSVLFQSHFIEDTYVPVYLWAKYIRKPPEMEDGTVEGFNDFINNTVLGKILMIAVDQIIHLLFVLVVAIIIVLGS